MCSLNGVANCSYSYNVSYMLDHENNFKQPQMCNRKCNLILQRIRQWAMKKIVPVMSTKILIKLKAMY